MVTYIYEGKEIYDYAVKNGVNASTIANLKLTLYSSEEAQIEKLSKLDIKYNHNMGQYSDFSIQATNEISKGNIYANYDAKNKTETEYSVKYLATIYNVNLIEEIEFEQGIDKFTTEDKKEGLTTLNNNNLAYNKRI